MLAYPYQVSENPDPLLFPRTCFVASIPGLRPAPRRVVISRYTAVRASLLSSAENVHLPLAKDAICSIAQCQSSSWLYTTPCVSCDNALVASCSSAGYLTLVCTKYNVGVPRLACGRYSMIEIWCGTSSSILLTIDYLK